MVIETERLILRSFQEKDTGDLFDYLHMPTVNCFMDMKVSTIAEASEAIAERMKKPEYFLAISLKDTERVIGEIAAFPERADEHSKDSPLDTFSPIWMLNGNYQGKGYAYEAAHAFLGYLFQEKGARRIYAYVEDYNVSSQHLCEKLGMRREGLFLKFVSFVKNLDGTPKYENTYQYAILKKEWN